MSSEIAYGLLTWETVRRQQLVDAVPWLQLWVETVRLPNGRLLDSYYTLDQPDYTVVFAMTEANQVIGLWHYKHGARRITLGLPAGYVEPGEEPLDAARRELLEETGYRAETWQHLGSYSVDGNRGCGHAHIYLAGGLQRVRDPQPDDVEEMRLVFLSVHALGEHLRSGKVATLGAASAIALGLLTLNHSSEG